MSTDRQGVAVVIECDTCDETIRSRDNESWGLFWTRAKNAGWSSAKFANEWVHGCPRHDAK